MRVVKENDKVRVEVFDDGEVLITTKDGYEIPDNASDEELQRIFESLGVDELIKECIDEFKELYHDIAEYVKEAEARIEVFEVMVQ